MLPKRMIFAQFGTLLSKNEVYDNIAENVFSIKLNTHNAEVQYSRHGDVYDLIYTNLPEQFRGQNLGHILAERIFDHLVERKKKIKITCEFLQFFYEKNKAKYKDFVVEQ